MSVILSLYPNTRGINYACLHLPDTVIDCGLIKPFPFSTRRFLKRVDRFIAYFKPSIVLLRSIESDKFKGKMANELITAISDLAKQKGLPVYAYTRRQIREVFEIHNARSKHEISQKIISWIPYLSMHTPRIRKLWVPEDHRMGIFDAVALAITYEHLTS